MAKHEVDGLLEVETQVVARRIVDGFTKHRAEFPPFRYFGPLLPIYDTRGMVLQLDDNRHPFGPRKPKYVRACFDGCDCPECRG